LYFGSKFIAYLAHLPDLPCCDNWAQASPQKRRSFLEDIEDRKTRVMENTRSDPHCIDHVWQRRTCPRHSSNDATHREKDVKKCDMMDLCSSVPRSHPCLCCQQEKGEIYIHW
jgi:hypothetical protein